LIYEIVRHTFISMSRSAAVPELWTLGVLRIMRFMSFRYLGQASVPELASLPANEQRRLYRRAAWLSFKDWRTWFALVFFITVLRLSSFLSESPLYLVTTFSAAWICYRLQLAAIRKQVRILFHEPHA
jgi:hypothetical protein